MRLTRISFGVLLVGFLSGCYDIEDGFNDFMISSKIQTTAHWSWFSNRSLYRDVDHSCHFAKGYTAGYQNVAGGGNGCQPILPPRNYWKVCYQSAKGQCKIQAWFDGFSHGGLAAAQDNASLYSRIPTSSTGKVWYPEEGYGDEEYSEETVTDPPPAPTPAYGD